MRSLAVSLALAVGGITVFAATADARDRLVKKDRMTARVSGTLTADYGKDPDPTGQGGKLKTFGTYSGTWTWTRTLTTSYRRSRRTGKVYRSGTEGKTTATLNETSSIRIRFYDGSASGEPCPGGGASNQTVRKSHGGDAVRQPRLAERFFVASGASLSRRCNEGLETEPSGVLRDICVWGCWLPAGQFSAGSRQQRTGRSGAVFNASYSVSVSFDLGDSIGKKTENRLPDDF